MVRIIKYEILSLSKFKKLPHLIKQKKIYINKKKQLQQQSQKTYVTLCHVCLQKQVNGIKFCKND